MPVGASCMQMNEIIFFAPTAEETTTSKTVTDVHPRKVLLKRCGRCFVCLWKDHKSCNCTSKSQCHSCSGKQHVSICQTKLNAVTPTYPVTTVSTPVPQQQGLTVQPGTNSVVLQILQHQCYFRQLSLLFTTLKDHSARSKPESPWTAEVSAPIWQTTWITFFNYQC